MEMARHLVTEICNDHLSAVEVFVRDPDLRSSLAEKIRAECQELIEYVVAARRFNLEINARSKDRAISFGEKLSCLFMTALLQDAVRVSILPPLPAPALRDPLHLSMSLPAPSPPKDQAETNPSSQGVEAEYVDLSDALNYDAAAHLDPSFYKTAAAVFTKKIAACEGRVPVVTGFFGNVPGSLIDGDIGRGYTDLCAALCAVGLKAEELQVWKEVDGIFTADPSKVPTARLLLSITPSEAAELTFYGSEVIHHLTMDQVIFAQPPIPIRIKNVNNPRGTGTVVIPDPILSAAHQLHRSRPSEVNLVHLKKPKRPTAVTIKKNISVINVHSNKRSISHGFFAKVFSILDEHSISVDLISTSEVHVSLAIHSSSAELGAFSKAKQKLEECGDVSVLSGMAILSLVGADMKNMVGVAGRMFSTLGEHRINIEIISQGKPVRLCDGHETQPADTHVLGASEINISCVIHDKDADRAMNVLHTHLFTFLD